MGRLLSTSSMALVLAVACAGCASAVGQAAPPAPPPEEMPVDMTLSSLTDAVLADAASRTGLEKARLVVESAAAVTWADGSLGCPQPGMIYTMALVPGYRIVVRAGGRRLDYHASRRGYFVLCPSARSVDPIGDAAV